jgi:hypothetical protein
MQSLAVLRADSNRLQYYLPSDWGAAGNLSVLSLRKNDLTGALPGGMWTMALPSPLPDSEDRVASLFPPQCMLLTNLVIP